MNGFLSLLRISWALDRVELIRLGISDGGVIHSYYFAAASGNQARSRPVQLGR